MNYEVEDEFGEGRTTIKGFIFNDKFYKWRIRMEPEIEDLYSTIDISKALNIPRERLRDWMVRDFIKPSFVKLLDKLSDFFRHRPIPQCIHFDTTVPHLYI